MSQQAIMTSRLVYQSPLFQSDRVSTKLYLASKRVLDIAVASIMVVLLSPLMGLVALLIKLTDGGSVFFCQTRVGEHGEHFKCFKFRSMVANADALKAQLASENQHSDDRTFKMKKDPRITWIGKIIRKTSMDELPQLFNIILGDMTLVGPRPAVPSEVEKYDSHERRRLSVKPGLTCIWQISGRADLPFPEQVRLDIEYIQKRNLWLDLKLLVLTVPAVLSAKGAY